MLTTFKNQLVHKAVFTVQFLIPGCPKNCQYSFDCSAKVGSERAILERISSQFSGFHRFVRGPRSHHGTRSAPRRAFVPRLPNGHQEVAWSWQDLLAKLDGIGNGNLSSRNKFGSFHVRPEDFDGVQVFWVNSIPIERGNRPHWLRWVRKVCSQKLAFRCVFFFCLNFTSLPFTKRTFHCPKPQSSLKESVPRSWLPGPVPTHVWLTTVACVRLPTSAGHIYWRTWRIFQAWWWVESSHLRLNMRTWSPRQPTRVYGDPEEPWSFTEKGREVLTRRATLSCMTWRMGPWKLHCGCLGTGWCWQMLVACHAGSSSCPLCERRSPAARLRTFVEHDMTGTAKTNISYNAESSTSKPCLEEDQNKKNWTNRIR